MNATQAIARSISHNEVVTLDYDADDYAALVAACEDSVEGNRAHEFWGSTEGGEWRVHMAHDVRVTTEELVAKAEEKEADARAILAEVLK